MESDYAALGFDEAVYLVLLRPLAVGESLVSLGEVVRAILFKHASGPGGYSPSYKVAVDAKLERRVVLSGGEGGAFAVRVEPQPDPALREHLWLDGELVLDPRAWPLTFRGDGRFDRRILTRTGEHAADGQLSLSVAWTYS